MRIMKAFDTADENRGRIWNQVSAQAKWRMEMGAYLVISPQVARTDKVALNLQIQSIVGLAREFKEDQGWQGACLDMGLMQLASRMDAINRIASNYPEAVRQYKEVKKKAEKGQSLSEPRTKFIQTWAGHFKQPLLNEFMRQFEREHSL